MDEIERKFCIQIYFYKELDELALFVTKKSFSNVFDSLN